MSDSTGAGGQSAWSKRYVIGWYLSRSVCGEAAEACREVSAATTPKATATESTMTVRTLESKTAGPPGRVGLPPWDRLIRKT
jgi:hypothetical protein